ncbi:MAG: hypothetical protein O6848_08865 [Bacteroidetes bacterium]|nr:hypothetical protein [Bacteroidota bacterium]
MDSQEEKKNQRIGAAVSVGIHGLVLLLFLFVFAWKAPDPPLPEYGIELNFGIGSPGSGIQPVTTPVESETIEESQLEEPIDNPIPTDIEQHPHESSETVVDETEMESESSLEEMEVRDVESPDVRQPAPEKTEPNIAENEKSGSQITETSESSVQVDVTDDGPELSVQPKQQNQGDEIETLGDSGDPKGKLDARALYGKPGGGDGASLQLAGWIWDFLPEPDDQSQENGRIVFEIMIDEQGELIAVRTIEKTVSPQVEKIYKSEVEKLTFSTTSDNTIPAPRSTGTITFIIRSR